MHKPAKAAVPTPQQPVPPPQLEPEAPLPPDQIPNPAPPAPQVPPPPVPPVHIPDSVHPQDPPVHLPDPIQSQNPTVHIPNPVQPPGPPDQIINQMPQLNWSYFKPEFSGEPEEDVEVHLLRTNDWMETHNFTEVQRFCLTLTGEARLWYESLRLIVVDWMGLQECFRQQYSKFHNMQQQLFHVWRSFHYDENMETIDAYVNRIKQVAVLLNYGEPQILELFKETHYLANFIGFYFLLTI